MKRLFFVLASVLFSISTLAQEFTHLVKSDDTLQSIAKNYGISVEKLKQLNPKLEFYPVKVGDVLRVPNQGITKTTVVVEKKSEEQSYRHTHKPYEPIVLKDEKKNTQEKPVSAHPQNKAYEQIALLGITYRYIDQEFINQFGKKTGIKKIGGVYVVTVSEGGSASKAGICKGDIITEINGMHCTSATTISDQIKMRRPNDVIFLGIKRGDRVEYTSVTLPSHSAEKNSYSTSSGQPSTVNVSPNTEHTHPSISKSSITKIDSTSKTKTTATISTPSTASTKSTAVSNTHSSSYSERYHGGRFRYVCYEMPVNKDIRETTSSYSFNMEGLYYIQIIGPLYASTGLGLNQGWSSSSYSYKGYRYEYETNRTNLNVPFEIGLRLPRSSKIQLDIYTGPQIMCTIAGKDISTENGKEQTVKFSDYIAEQKKIKEGLREHRWNCRWRFGAGINICGVDIGVQYLLNLRYRDHIENTADKLGLYIGFSGQF